MLDTFTSEMEGQINAKENENEKTNKNLKEKMEIKYPDGLWTLKYKRIEEASGVSKACKLFVF